MSSIWAFLLQTASVSLAAALLLLLKTIFADKLSPRWQYGIWSLLALRILLPVGMERGSAAAGLDRTSLDRLRSGRRRPAGDGGAVSGAQFHAKYAGSLTFCTNSPCFSLPLMIRWQLANLLPW